MTAEDELEKLIKKHTRKKKNSVFIQIRGAKDVKDLRMKTVEKGIVKLRVHSTHEDYPKWYIHGYLIHLKHLGLFKKKFKKDILRLIFSEPHRAKISKAAKELLEELKRDYGDIIPNSITNKLKWRTEKFKKKKDPFKRVYKTL